jgi:hypothetical protein
VRRGLYARLVGGRAGRSSTTRPVASATSPLDATEPRFDAFGKFFGGKFRCRRRVGSPVERLDVYLAELNGRSNWCVAVVGPK